jgi:dolichyl-phosphate beta-glucosyltransferase
MDDIKLSIVIPCHNSSGTIASVLERIAEFSSESNPMEIIAIENGSTDNTWAVLNDLKASAKLKFILRIYQSEKGLGRALRKGIKHAMGRIIIFMADDLPFGTQEIEFGMTQNLEVQGYFIFSKYRSSKGYKRTLMRSLSGLGFAVIRESMLKTRVFDSQGTFCGKSEIVRQIFKNTSENEFLITTEAILIARKYNYKVHEIPINQLEPENRPSTIAPRDVLRMLRSLRNLQKRRREFK